jgi:signal peptidase I
VERVNLADPAIPVYVEWIGVLFRGLLAAAAATLSGLLVWALLPVLMGWSPTVILTGSMSPQIQPGDVVVVAPFDSTKESAKPGMVILANNPAQPGKQLVHRVAKKNTDGTYVTKGDANAAADSTPVSPSSVKGLARLRIPMIGLPKTWIHEQRYGPLVALLILLMLLSLAPLLGGRLHRKHVELPPQYRPTVVGGHTRHSYEGRHLRFHPARSPLGIAVLIAVAVGAITISGINVGGHSPPPSSPSVATYAANSGLERPTFYRRMEELLGPSTLEFGAGSATNRASSPLAGTFFEPPSSADPGPTPRISDLPAGKVWVTKTTNGYVNSGAWLN